MEKKKKSREFIQSALYSCLKTVLEKILGMKSWHFPMLHHGNLFFNYPKWTGISGVQRIISSGSWVMKELGLQLVMFLDPGTSGLHKSSLLWLSFSNSKQS